MIQAGRPTFVALVLVTAVGQLVGVAYEIAIASRFGTRRDADALALALTLVFAVANEISGWISALFIPHYVAARASDGDASALGFFRKTLVLTGFVTGGLALLLVVGAPGLVALLAPALAGDGGGVGLLRLFAPIVVLMPLAALLAGAVQAHGHFIAAAMRQLYWYGGAVGSIALVGTGIGVASVPLGMASGLMLFCGLLLWAVARAARGDHPVDPAPERLGQALQALPPLALASVANYVAVTVERGIAGRLPEGSLAALTYAFRLLNLPINLVVLNATAMLLPALARHAASENRPAIEAAVDRTLRLALVFTVPIAALGIGLAEPGVRVLLERGAFTGRSTSLTALALAVYAPAIVGMAGVHVVSRVYQALREIWRLVLTSLAVIGANVALMVLLTRFLGFVGLPLATTLTWLGLAGALLAVLRTRLSGLRVSGILAAAGRVGAAGALALAAVVVVRATGPGGDVALLIAATLAGGGVYTLALAWLARPEARLGLELLAGSSSVGRAIHSP